MHQATLDEFEKFSPEKIVEGIVTQMRKAQQEVTWKLLGMDNRWGKWEIDHCNGRISPLSEELAQHAKPMLIQMVGEMVTEVVAETLVDPTMREKVKQAIRKEVEGFIAREIRTKQYEAATRVASDIIKGIEREVRSEIGI